MEYCNKQNNLINDFNIQMAGSDATSGASIAASGTKNNRLNMTRDEYIQKRDEYIQAKLIENNIPQEMWTTEAIIYGDVFDTEMKKISINNDEKLYGEKMSTMEGREDVKNMAGISNVTKDGYVIGGFAPEFGKEFYFHKEYGSPVTETVKTDFGTFNIPVGVPVNLIDEKDVYLKKRDLALNVGISVIPWVSNVVGVGTGIYELLFKGEVLNGSVDIGSSVPVDNIWAGIVGGIVAQYFKYEMNNPDGIVKMKK